MNEQDDGHMHEYDDDGYMDLLFSDGRHVTDQMQEDPSTTMEEPAPRPLFRQRFRDRYPMPIEVDGQEQKKILARKRGYVEEEEEEDDPAMRARKRPMDEGWMPIASRLRRTENGEDEAPAEGDTIEYGPKTKTQSEEAQHPQDDAQHQREGTISTHQKQKDMPGKSRSKKAAPRRGPGSATSSIHHDEDHHPYYDFNRTNGTEWDPNENMTATSSNMQQFVFGPRGQGVFVRDINKKIP